MKRRTRSRHSYTPHHLAVLVLSIRHCEQNNAKLCLLSASNVGITIPPNLVDVLETMIVNAMTKIAERKDGYIPPNMERVIRVLFHIDKFDKQVQTLDEKDIVHYLLIICFDIKMGEFKPIELNLEKLAF